MIAHEPGTDGHPFSLKGWFQLDDETQICIWGRIMFSFHQKHPLKKPVRFRIRICFVQDGGPPINYKLVNGVIGGPYFFKKTEKIHMGLPVFFGSPHHFKWESFFPYKNQLVAPRPSMEWLERRGHDLPTTTLTPSFTVGPPKKRWRLFFGNDETTTIPGWFETVFLFLCREFQAKPKPAFFCGGIPSETCSCCDCYWGERSNCWCVGDMLWWRSSHCEGCNEGSCRQSVMKLRSKSTERTNLQIPFPQLDYTRWWFQVFFVFTLDPWGNDPSWRIFFKRVGSTTN